MSPKIINANRSTGVALATDENVRLLAGVSITVTGSGSVRAISAIGPSNSAEIQGTITSTGFGVDLGREVPTTIGHSVYVNSSGSITASANAVVLSGGGGSLTNFGSVISTSQSAVRFSGGTTNPSTIENHGTIRGAGGIVNYGDGNLRVENFDLIEATEDGQSAFYSTTTAPFRNVFINHANVIGSMTFGAGNDVYNGAGGNRDGFLYGGGGDDRFVIGKADQGNIFGDAGRDTLDLIAFKNGARITLGNGGLNSNGVAYIGIEVVTGSRIGADRITGSETFNSLYGNGGNDSLFGGSGDDALYGGTGRDRLSGDNGTDALRGGAGNDTFVILDQSFGADFILDFNNRAGNNDQFRLDASGFNVDLGIGALKAAWFRAGTTNKAQDTNDHFLFRTTDTTLWYDANGSGAGGLHKIADLQAGAIMTATDIFLF